MLIHAFPITNGRSVKLHDVLDDLWRDVDRSGALIFWDDIGSPRAAGPVYERSRTEQRAEVDAIEAAVYEESVRKVGGSERRYRQQEVAELASQMGVADDELPALVVWIREPACDPCLLRIPKEMLVTETGRLELQELIVSELSDETLQRILIRYAERPIEMEAALSDHLERLQGLLVAWCEANHPVRSVDSLRPDVLILPGGWRDYHRLGVQLNPQSRRFRIGNQEVPLKPRHLDVLRFMLEESAGGIVSIPRAAIVEAAGGKDLRDIQKGSALLKRLIEPDPDGYGLYRLRLTDPD